MAKVLIVEDEEVSLRFYASVLNKAGHEVLQAPNGLGVAGMIRAEQPDVLLTDLVMPDCEGFEMIMALRKEKMGLPIIAMSAHENYLSIVEELGADFVLHKPFSETELVQAVAAAVAKPA
ncbi:MAG: response regulator [Gammaproteobacteria bacterium]|nr:response regulator [Gammaproteobacteria bacterium]